MSAKCVIVTVPDISCNHCTCISPSRPRSLHLPPRGQPAGADLLAGRHRAARRRQLHAALHQGRSRLRLHTGEPDDRMNNLIGNKYSVNK